ncbi:MAG: hypothetical protein QF486_01110 [Candidatus Woesearchaeota archaeon]|jgi:hypothetical protein|nr:hypothetical protein [Candidatus Woesearchaeota archaeon]MDP7198197.1 hypothetical protein [Candidatus Woesearchaeota archaeon]MDP7467033.1 hypothetical protein [Candidatus Woesearchaeota archaeon]MDP7646702.1 hypothetical protein [Candidatus Woesearchaeota archaeon]
MIPALVRIFTAGKVLLTERVSSETALVQKAKQPKIVSVELQHHDPGPGPSGMGWPLPRQYITWTTAQVDQQRFRLSVDHGTGNLTGYAGVTDAVANEIRHVITAGDVVDRMREAYPRATVLLSNDKTVITDEQIQAMREEARHHELFPFA